MTNKLTEHEAAIWSKYIKDPMSLGDDEYAVIKRITDKISAEARAAHKVANSAVKPKGTTWTIEVALLFIQDIRPLVIQAGFDVGLTGSLLCGKQASDLDIIVYPLNASRFDRTLLAPIFDAFSRQLMSPGKVKRAWESLQSSDSKHVEKRKFPDGRLLDIFYLT